METNQTNSPSETIKGPFISNCFGHKEVFESRHENVISTILELDNGDIASGSYDSTIKVWSIATKKLLQEIKLPKQFPTSLIEIPSNILVASTSEGNIIAYSIATGRELGTIKVSTIKLTKIINLSENSFLTSGYDRCIKLWKFPSDLNENNFTQTSIRNEFSYEKCYDSVTCLCKLKEGQFCSGSLKKVQFWDADKYSSTKSFEAHNKSLSCLKLLSKNRLATGAWDGIVKIWDLETLNCLGTIHQDFSYKVFELFEINESTLMALVTKYVIIVNLNSYQCDTLFPLETFEEAGIVLKNSKKMVICASSHQLEMYS